MADDKQMAAERAPIGKDEAIDLLRDAVQWFDRLSPNTLTAREVLRLTAHLARTAPPSPSTAPEVDERAAFEAWATGGALTEYDSVIERRADGRYVLPEMWREWEAWSARATLASRPAEVDDEGLPLLPEPVDSLAQEDGFGVIGTVDVFTAEQYRQGQRDAVAADRERRGDGWISVKDHLPEIGKEVLVYRPNSERGTVTALARFIRYEGASDFYWDNSYPGKGNMHLDTSITHWMPIPAAPSRATNQEEA